MTILLTGGAGYIGSHVLFACLAAGHEVVVLDDFSNSSPAAVSRVRELAVARSSCTGATSATANSWQTSSQVTLSRPPCILPAKKP